MNKTETEKVIDIFSKWFERTYSKDYTKLIEYYGYQKEGAHHLIAFLAGYKAAAKDNKKAITKARKDGLTCGIVYTAGILNRFYDQQSAEFILKESSTKSKKELRDAECEEYDIDNIGDLLPEEEA
jgi:hypothetical protein